MAPQTLKYTTKLAGKRVLILGGTSGIGFCVAEAALEHGADVIISSSHAAKVTKSIARLQDAYPELTGRAQAVSGYPCDLADSAALEANLTRLLEQATDGGKRKLHHVAFTAGNALQLPALQDLAVDAVHAAGTVRFLAPTILAKILPQYMDRSPDNSFTVTGGAAAQRPSAGWSVMAAYAAGTEGLVRGLALDLKPIRVNIVSPGPVHTELFDGFGEIRDAVLEAFKEKSLTGAVGRPEDVAEAYIYIMKDRYITGSCVASNGGSVLA
ncbi:NAD(P)-binding protein [Aspergillus eucalypticola CBS 122712]|uniref:NAD(P)-binding protein n=1 Tax=Aspergillus eucalypticola (strain CBS 122712 / IBT 29274) TaxID=1448314 RepID=A0A317UVB6_ASPEC|nr:NAD(P)-binding protein [Aspergillus eucalypticola CBS 122712]PWY65391.1 NAD(P)-binding protein [Aspergillus eucalypticola CBS 122712]